MISKEKIYESLIFWNYWNRKPDNIIERPEYQKLINQYKSTNEIIVFEGIRRSGKSTLMLLEIKNLLDSKTNPNNILFVNFEDPLFYDNLNLNLLDNIYETYLEYLNPKGKIYLFLDEVQNINAWEKWVLKFYETNKNMQIFVTGSSSKLLSSEFSTALSGRHLKIKVFPLNFKEYLFFNNLNIKNKSDLIKNKIKIKRLLKEYLNYGGFPKLTSLKNKQNKKIELIEYFDTIILKDISKRYKISTEYIKKLAFYLMSNNAKLYSINNLKKMELGSYETIKKYIRYLKEVYLIFDLQIFDYSVKKQMINHKKNYSIDTGFVNSVSFKFSENIGHLLENVVFIELKRRNKEIYYHKKKYECDFVIKENNQIVTAIQVSQTISDSDTKKREINGLLDAMKTYNLKTGLILTEDEEKIIHKKNDENINYKIIVKPIWKWLLSE
ncbi:MAG: ATP-binding protein [Candidatus Marinimicrobia bacterium]|nr:ATP-binding protein [Candidatus Neomarinimicrobiota bacterium]